MTMTSEPGRLQVKDPSARKDYEVDWSVRYPDDVVVQSTWAADADSGLLVTGDTHTDTHARAWISGGVVGGPYRVTNHIVTAAGREDDRSFVFTVTEQ